ncbi:helix-turn-helix domain-containing protein [uncultured Halopseudomonas sp.]|uniref:helix-turn-helix domain-containing protein n=1 Tax=uncultured Halopseudomonas sp. TaxID=2901193 RepID=UPI0030ECCC3D|tara:strand:- start:7148 stop:7552 length:405 start_codon:yes stop_codon:yes gene_type:complete
MDLGERLRAERKRLGFSQTEFAELAGSSKHAQINWEKGVAAPNALALRAWAEEGLDVLFVVLGTQPGVKPRGDLPPDEQLLLESYRGMAAKTRKELLAEMLTGRKVTKAKARGGVSVSGNNNRAAGGTYHENKE